MFHPGIKDHCCSGVFGKIPVFHAPLKFFVVLNPLHPGPCRNTIK